MGEIRDAIKHGIEQGRKPPAERETWAQHKQATAPEPRGIDDVRPGDTEILAPSERPATTPRPQSPQSPVKLDRSVERLFNWSIGLVLAPYVLAVIAFIVFFAIIYAILT